jgi:hypothetical protein
MGTWFIIRMLGGLVFSAAHRSIVRKAWRESWSWGLCAMFVPGVSLAFAHRYRSELGKPLGAQVIGLLLMTAGVLMAGREGWAEEYSILPTATHAEEAPLPTHAAASVPAATPVPMTAHSTTDLPKWYADLKSRRPSLKTPEEIAAFNAEAAEYEAAVKQSQAPVATAAPSVLPGKPAELRPLTLDKSGLYTWRVSLEEKRKTLQTSDKEAVRVFNEEVAKFHAASSATKPLRDELRPLDDHLKTLSSTASSK